MLRLSFGVSTVLVILLYLKRGLTKLGGGVQMSSVLKWPKKRPSIEQELEHVRQVVDRLRDMAEQALPDDHPCTKEIEDFWWHTKRFAEAIKNKIKAD